MKLGWNGSSSGKSSETKRPASSVFGREADDDEGEEDGSKRTKVQLISGLAGSQFVGLGPDHAATTPVGPLVIPMIEQNEWRATDRLPGRVKVNSAVAEIVKEGASLSRKPTGPASDVLGFEKTEIVTPSLGDTGKQWGLQISSRKEASAAMASSKSSVEVAPIQDPMEGIVTEAPKSLEDQAMDRLMAEARGEVDVSKDTVGPRVLPILVQNTVPGLEDLKSEAEKFKHDVNMRPDVV